MSVIKVGNPIRKIRSVQARSNWEIEVAWDDDGEACAFVVDLEPTIFAYKFYRPLRNNRALFETVHVDDFGTAIAWGSDEIDMSSSTVERLAQEAMSPHDFSAFLKRHGFSFEEAAAQFGISRRQVAYFASHKIVPRSIALACAYLDIKAAERSNPHEDLNTNDPVKNWIIYSSSTQLEEHEITSLYHQSHFIIVDPKPPSRGPIIDDLTVQQTRYQVARLPS